MFEFDVSALDCNQLNFLKYKAMEGLSYNTLYGYSKDFKVFNEVAHGENLEEKVLNFFLEKRNLKGGYNGYRKRLNTYFNFLIEREIIEENPILKLGIRRKKEEAEPRPAEKESLKKILNLLDLNNYTEFRDYVFILLTLDTGIRPAEAVQIYENLFDYYNKDLRITPSIGKCNKSRILPLSDGVIKYIKRLFEINKKNNFKSNNLFLSDSGKELSTTAIQRKFARYCDILELYGEDRITPYQLRHYFATTYLENGGNIVYLQYLMGHGDIKMTKKYLKINQDSVANEHRRFSPVNDIMFGKKRITKINL